MSENQNDRILGSVAFILFFFQKQMKETYFKGVKYVQIVNDYITQSKMIVRLGTLLY